MLDDVRLRRAPAADGLDDEDRAHEREHGRHDRLQDGRVELMADVGARRGERRSPRGHAQAQTHLAQVHFPPRPHREELHDHRLRRGGSDDHLGRQGWICDQEERRDHRARAHAGHPDQHASQQSDSRRGQEARIHFFSFQSIFFGSDGPGNAHVRSPRA